jgi:chromosome segregation ATPase
MLGNMKTGRWVLIVGLILSFLPGCRKGEESRTAEVTSPVSTPSEEELREEKKALEALSEETSARYKELRRSVGELKEVIAETSEKLNLLNAEKEKMRAVEADLTRRWEKELEGIGEGSMDGTAIEIYSRLAVKAEALLQENQDLKRRLEGSGK